MALLGIDELNTVPKEEPYKNRAMDFEKYFGEMELTEEQKKKRIAIAKDFEDMFLFIMALVMIMQDQNRLDFYAIQAEVESRYREIVERYNPIDEYLDDYITKFAGDFCYTTKKNIDKPWFISDDRAKFIAENEANTEENYQDYIEAIKSGYTRKKWVDIRDNRERKTHREVGGKVIGIFDYFHVGKSYMRFPKDTEMAGDYPEEIINCRCSCKWLDRDDEVE